MSKQNVRLAARDAIHRFLGNPTGQAEAMVGELNPAEAEAIAEAGENKQTARQEIKAVLSRAYDRRSASAAEEARRKSERLRRFGLARAVIAAATRAGTADALRLARGLNHAEIDSLYELDLHAVQEDPETVEQVLATAAARRGDVPPAEQPAEETAIVAADPAGTDEDTELLEAPSAETPASEGTAAEEAKTDEQAQDEQALAHWELNGGLPAPEPVDTPIPEAVDQPAPIAVDPPAPEPAAEAPAAEAPAPEPPKPAAAPAKPAPKLKLKK